MDLGLDSQYTRDGHEDEDEAGYALQPPTLKHVEITGDGHEDEATGTTGIKGSARAHTHSLSLSLSLSPRVMVSLRHLSRSAMRALTPIFSSSRSLRIFKFKFKFSPSLLFLLLPYPELFKSYSSKLQQLTKFAVRSNSLFRLPASSIRYLLAVLFKVAGPFTLEASHRRRGSRSSVVRR